MELQFLIFPIIGAGIGWFTNVLAIRLLFRPQSPIRIPLLNIEFQGVLPKRQDEIADNVGVVIEEELLRVEDIIEQLKSSKFKEELTETIIHFVEKRIMETFPLMVPDSVRNILTKYLNDFIVKEMDLLYFQLICSMEVKLRQKQHIQKMIRRRIKNFDLRKLEGLILDVARRELRYIEILGAFMGFMIGIFQLIVFLLL